ncbi:MAG: hypothetical protein A2849_00560 [Candidatus Taylorbacteria bacterium RIFCSPHIGHO2_01_FULL_51_15]|uniref:Uncharacterized protein n=1 Tax=Candidatus Taylorbacteria bacterium RIFCSPHIGHO2_01_FULL_51_15 TaxID=1802304 RepID=A0A1G2ME05_9BACT|nr:MAG: hypothetical protein A2849_00560 [Candidatus Taylorbacteria bacterium RIFCSPHIGHO2_01_FULL_51_15]
MPYETPPTVAETVVERLKRQAAEVEKKIVEIDETIDERIELMYKSGELERPEKPTAADQLGWESPGHRTALRNMRNTDMIRVWYQYTPEIFEQELLTETIMQGVWVDVRKSEKFDSGFKDRMRVKKRQYVRYSGDLTLGFHPNVTKRLNETHGHALDELRKLANKRMQELGPTGKNEKGEEIRSYFDVFAEDFIYDEKKRNISEEYRKLIEEHNAMVPEEERISDAVTPKERATLYYGAGQAMWDAVSQNLADNEFTLMPGSLRELYVVMRNMDENKLQNYRDRDLDVKIPMVEFFIEQFKDEVLGVREATKNNLELFTWFVNKQGQSFIPFNALREDLKDWWEIIKSLLGRPKDSRVQPSIYPYLQDDRSGGNNSKVMQKLNEFRAERGLSRWTVDETPFARIGFTTGFAKQQKK